MGRTSSSRVAVEVDLEAKCSNLSTMKCAMTISVAMLLLLALTGVVTATAPSTPRRGLRALFGADADLDVDLKTGSVGYAGTVTTPFYSGSVVWGASASGPGGPS